jgi:hypothetical protein
MLGVRAPSDHGSATGTGGNTMPPWLIAFILFGGLMALNVSFVMAARAIRRDMTRRFDELQRGLESRANSIVDKIFDLDSTEFTTDERR